MPTRSFTDKDGNEWIVWSVHPTWVERRGGSDRRLVDVDEHERRAREQRHVPDRRRGLSDSGPRVKMSTNLTGGWLAFEGAGERRRLTPIPAGWETMSEPELAGLWARATVAPVTRRRLIE
jgi:hypothetical protein